MPRKPKRLRSKVNVGRDENGQIIYKWVSAYNAHELKIKKTKVMLDIAKDPIANASQQSSKPAEPVLYFNDYAEKWYTLYKKPHLRPSAQIMYENILKNHLNPRFENRPLNAISDDELQAFFNMYTSSSKSMIHKIKLTLSQIFERAKYQELIHKNPMQNIRLPQGTVKERKGLDYESVEPLIQALLGHEDGLLPLLMLCCGLRRGEALGIRYSDIVGNTLNLHQQITYRGNKPNIGDLKTSSAERSIPIPSKLLPLLFKRKPEQKPEQFLFGGDEPFTESKFDRLWQRLQRDLPALQKVTPHILRHTYTNMLRRVGVDPATAQYLLGHADYSTTVDVYTHIDKHDISDAHSKINSIFSD